MRVAQGRENLAVFVLVVISAVPALFLTGPQVSLWIVVAVGFGWLSAVTILPLVRRLIAPPVVAAAPGGLNRQSGKTRREYLVPAQLPPPPGFLVGRDAEVDAICTVLARPGIERFSRDDRPPVVVVSGGPGVGKSALAICAAHLVADQYPDGQLLVRFDTRGGRSADDALVMFIGALKGPGEPMPVPAERERWYSDRLVRRRVLVILDNVTDIAQISRLLPAGRRCAAIVTARASLPGLEAQLSVPLTPLDRDASWGLFSALVGERRVAAEPACASRIVAASAGYPVALQMAGAALAGRKNWTLDIAVRRMDEVALPPGRRADLASFASILDLAFALLTERERTGLALLGLLDRRTVAPWMLAALFHGALPDAEPIVEAHAGRVLDRLACARFAERRVDDTSGVLAFRVPVYVQAYARAWMPGQLSTDHQDAAKQEFVEEQRRRGDRTPDWLLRRTVYRLLDEGRLSAALDASREALALSQELRSAVQKGTAEEASVAAEEGLTLAALAEVYAELGWIEEGMTCAESAMAKDKESVRSRPRALRVLGTLQRRQHLIPEAERNLLAAERAVQMINDPADAAEQIRVLRELAVAQSLSDEPRRGIATAEEAKRLCTVDGGSSARRLPGVLWAYGQVLLACQDPVGADHVLREADRLSTDPSAGQGLWRPWIRHQRAVVAFGAGCYEQSRELGLSALDAFTSLRHRYGSAHCRLVIGRAYLAEDRIDKATSVLEEAHSTLRRCGDRWIEATAATALARAYRRAERGREAVALLTTAEQAFIKVGDVQSQLCVSRLLSEVESSLPLQPRSSQLIPVTTS
jgi:tetratricopeptide (TPR) repeat protein